MAEVDDLLQKLNVQVDQFAMILADKPDDDAEYLLEVARQELSRGLRTTFGPAGARALAGAWVDTVERRSREIDPVRSRLLN